MDGELDLLRRQKLLVRDGVLLDTLRRSICEFSI